MESQKFGEVVESVCFEIADMLKAKNDAYGDSALDPIQVFSKADPIEQLKVRIDDKISRMIRGKDAGEDTRMDLIGYLILLEVYEREIRRKNEEGALKEVSEKFKKTKK